MALVVVIGGNSRLKGREFGSQHQMIYFFIISIAKTENKQIKRLRMAHFKKLFVAFLA